MSESRLLSVGDHRVELLLDGSRFLGIGRAWIGDTPVRSGRLPIRPWTQAFGSGLSVDELTLREIEEDGARVTVRLEVGLGPAPTSLMRDHSFDPIHDTTDWTEGSPSTTAELDLVLEPATDRVVEHELVGFAYHWAWRSEEVPIFFLLEKASWELDGDITGATVVNQSSCSDPLVTIEEQTAWSTEGRNDFHRDRAEANPVMTHNLPRWASHQAFDFQYRAGTALLGIYERVGLVRTVLKREPGKAELKCFDKHIFDEAAEHATPAKKILLATDVGCETDQRNLWTWALDTVHDRARAEFGLEREPTLPRVSQNYWVNFHMDSYFKDLLPAAESIGAKQVFIDNVNRSAMTDDGVGNMCCGHDYEPAPALGGASKLKDLVDRARAAGIQVMSWTNNDQAYTSPLNASERDERGWFVKMEDTRLKYGGAYTNVFSILDFSHEEPRRHWIECLKKIREATGLSGYLFDSFYNLGFMPVSYHPRPHTMWRQTLEAFSELQEADVHFLIESLGPFGQPQHGKPREYSIDRCWVCYQVGLGNDYTTVPSGPTFEDPRAGDAAAVFFCLAHMTLPPMALFKDGKRIDQRWGPAHRRALAVYHERMDKMHRRYLQEDGASVLWHDADGTEATLFNFEARSVALPGRVRDVTTGEDLEPAETFELEPMHAYAISADELPTRVEAAGG